MRNDKADNLVIVRIIGVEEILASLGIGGIINHLSEICIIPYLFNRIDAITGAGQRGLYAKGNRRDIAELNKVRRGDIGAEAIGLIIEILSLCDADVFSAGTS